MRIAQPKPTRRTTMTRLPKPSIRASVGMGDDEDGQYRPLKPARREGPWALIGALALWFVAGVVVGGLTVARWFR
jgi:hypothetical protein